jgi:hypothetical protein
MREYPKGRPEKKSGPCDRTIEDCAAKFTSEPLVDQARAELTEAGVLPKTCTICDMSDAPHLHKFSPRAQELLDLIRQMPKRFRAALGLEDNNPGQSPYQPRKTK